MTAPAAIPSHFPPVGVSSGTSGGQNAPFVKETAVAGPSREQARADSVAKWAALAEKEAAQGRARAARYRNKPGQRAKEAARLRKWRAMKRT